MREFYAMLSAIGDLMSLINGGLTAFSKRQVNKQAHKYTAKAMKNFWK